MNLRKQLADANQRNRDLSNDLHRVEVEKVLPLRSMTEALRLNLERERARTRALEAAYAAHRKLTRAWVEAMHADMVLEATLPLSNARDEEPR